MCTIKDSNDSVQHHSSPGSRLATHTHTAAVGEKMCCDDSGKRLREEEERNDEKEEEEAL